MVNLTINNEPVSAEADTTLLRVLEKQGIKVPTLCHHKALLPYGACRLCVVEVSLPGRPPALQASCSFPVIDGMSVSTDTDRVKRARKIVAELLLARCPDSEVIRRIALEQGVTEPRVRKKHDDCIYCGLCVRMCEERMGRHAIGFTGRGPRKKLEPPFGKRNEMCWACGACNFICPVGKRVTALTTEKRLTPIPDAYDMGLDERPCAYILYPQAVPNKAVLDAENCIHLNYGACGICKEVCEAKAIDYEQKDRTIELDAGAIIVSPGYEVFDPKVKPELGYGRVPNVVSALEFERILSASGPYAGHILRPSDKKTPKTIAFIQCVGSRDRERDYCSSVCCMYATKEAIIAKEHAGQDLRCDIYFMDIRAFSKGFEEYYLRAKRLGVNYIRCRIPRLEEVPETGNIRVKYLAEGDLPATNEYEMVVLSVGMQPPDSARSLAESLGIKLNRFGFCETSPFDPVASGREGIYVAGPFTEPKDIPETVTQASACAVKVMTLLRDARGTLIEPQVFPPERDVSGEEPRIGVFVCHCGRNIAGVVNVPEVAEYARTLPDVIYAEDNLYTCSNDTQQRIKEKIAEHHLNRVVVASCTPRTHEPLFRNTLREAGLNPYLFEMANIRDQCSWVHMAEPEKATVKAKDLLRMAVAKARLLEPLRKASVRVEKAALVIGGGLAGLTSAVELADQGFDVYLVEKENELGGNLRHVHYLLNGWNPREHLDSLIRKANAHEKIRLFTGARVVAVEGSIGNFKSTISADGSTREVEHGVVIVASGGAMYAPEEYLYGEDERVITQRELERRLASRNGLGFRLGNGRPGVVVMIQCVGSRDEERPYCSRVCCAEAVKNAIKLKEISPTTGVYVLYRDVRTYGFKESYYTKARELGVVFIRYDETKKPSVLRDGRSLRVEVFDQILGVPLEIEADAVVLSAAIVPNEDNKAIGQLLKVPLTQDGFFLEAHMKLRPIDFATDGVFLCGLAHGPKSIEETIIQAQAAAGRAATILAQDRLELEANVSHIIDENCDGCAYCVDPCPYKAITLVEYMYQGAVKKVAEVNEGICKGCGSCMATCPKKGAYVRGFTLDQIGAQVEAALQPV